MFTQQVKKLFSPAKKKDNTSYAESIEISIPPPLEVTYFCKSDAQSNLLTILPNDIWRLLFQPRMLSPVDIYTFRCTCRAALLIVSKLAPNISRYCEGKLYKHGATSSVTYLDWLEDHQHIHYPKSRHSEILSAAAATNNMDTITWLLQRNSEIDMASMDAAVANDHLALLQFLYAKNCQFATDPRPFYRAAERGHAASLSWFEKQQRPHLDQFTLLRSVCFGGNVELLKKMLEKSPGPVHQTLQRIGAIEATARGGSLPAVMFVLSCLMSTGQFDSEALDQGLSGSIEGRRRDMVELFLGKGAVVTTDHIRSAAAVGDASILQHLLELTKPIDLDRDSLVSAIRTGNLPTVQLIWEFLQTAPESAFLLANFGACDYAVQWNHLEVLLYLRSVGFRWSEATLIAAAASCSFDCLKYCLENGCPLQKHTLPRLMSLAAKYGHLQMKNPHRSFNVINYLHERHSLPIPADALSAAFKGDCPLHLRYYVSEVAQEKNVFSGDVVDIVQHNAHEKRDRAMISLLLNLVPILKEAENMRLQSTKK